MDEPARRVVCRRKGRPGTARSAALPRPRPGNSRGSRRPRPIPSDRHHSSAIRSGPSARVTRCGRRRQVKRNGGSSGSSQNASTGSGGSNSRIGRGGLPSSPRKRDAGIRARSRSPWAPARGGDGNRHPDRGPLRDVAFARFEPGERVEPEPVAEPVEERRDVRRRPGAGRAGKTDLLGRQWLDRKGGEDHVFDAEAGIDGVEPLLEERGEMVRIAARASGAEDGCARPGRRRGGRRDRAAALPAPSRARRRTRSSASRSAARARSAGSAIGSAKLSRTRRTGASPSGDSGSGRSSSAWSRRRATASPKRRASASRGIA